MADKGHTFPEYLVLDGGMGTEIIRRFPDGGKLNLDPLWSSRLLVSDESFFRGIHHDFLESGADVISTNTYKPSVENLMECMNITRQAALGLFQSAARVAVNACDEFVRTMEFADTPRPLVSGALGPYGARFFTGSEYTGDYITSTSIEDMVEGQRYKAEALIDGGVHILAFETIPVLKEGEAIAALMNMLPNSRAWVAFSCKDGEHVCHGEKFRDAVLTTMASDAIVGVGVNCSRPEHVTSLLQQVPDVVKQQKKIVVYPNNGLIWDREKKCWYGEAEAKPIHEYVHRWLELGANWIGGCCNVTPGDISEIRKEMKKYLKQ